MTADLHAIYDPMSRDELIAECERLRTVLRGISSCSTCLACAAVATQATRVDCECGTFCHAGMAGALIQPEGAQCRKDAQASKYCPACGRTRDGNLFCSNTFHAPSDTR